MKWIFNLHILPVLSKIAIVALLAAVGSFGGPIGIAIAEYVGSDEDFFKWGGAKATLFSTKDEWIKIKSKLDIEAAAPIGIYSAIARTRLINTKF